MSIDPKTVIDWDFIRDQELYVLRDYMAAASQAGEEFADGCSWGWNAKYAACTLYNLLTWWVRTLQWVDPSDLRSAAEQRLYRMLQHFIDKDFLWQYGRPPAEGFDPHPSKLDSDALRHQWAQGIARALLDPSLEIVDRGRYVEALSKWGDWLKSINLVNLRKADIRGQGAYYRSFAAIESLCWISIATQQQHYLTSAENLCAASLWQNEQPLDGAPGFSFWGGRDEFDGTCSMPSNSEHRTMRPWYAYNVGGLIALYALTQNEAVRTLIKTYILSVTDLVVKRNDLPIFNRPDTGGQRHAPVLLGSQVAAWDATSIQPATALYLRDGETYYPLAVVDAFERDHDYWNPTIPHPWGGAPILRRHYPSNRNPGTCPGPKLDFHQTYPLADALAARWYLTQDQNDLNWALWAYRDLAYYANRSSPWKPVRIGEKQGSWFGAGNIGRSRDLAWHLNNGLFLRDLLGVDGSQAVTAMKTDLK